MTNTKFLLAALANVAVLAALGLVDAAAVRRGNGNNLLNVHDLSKMDQNALLRNAVKVDKRMVHRLLDEEQQEDADEDNDGENADEDEADDEAADDEADDAEEDNEQQEDEQQNQEQDQEEEADEEEADEEDEEQILQLSFLKCGAFTVDPNVVDVDAMVEAGEIDEDQAAEMKAVYITEVTDYLNTQESIVFFTVGYSQNDEERELYMTTLENWISASMGYEDICHQLDEDDVDTIFSTVTDPTFAELYSGHAWFSGFNCLDDGTGFGTQLFLDETCNTYAPTMSNYYPFPEGSENLGAANQQQDEEGEQDENEENANVDYTYRVASDLTPYMIQNADYFLQNSHYCEEVEGQDQEEGEDNEEDQQMAEQAREFCENLFGVSVDVVTCAAYGEDEAQEQEAEECNCEEEEAADEQADEQADGEENDEGEEQEDEQDDEAEQDGEEGEDNAEEGEENDGEERRKKRRRNQECNCAQQDNGYQINYDAIGDVEASCSTVRNLLQIDPDNFNGLNAEYVVSMWSNAKDGHQNESNSGIKTGWIIAIAIASVVAICALLYCACAGRRSKSASGSGDKAEPLVSSANKPPRKKKESIEIYFQGSKRDATV